MTAALRAPLLLLASLAACERPTAVPGPATLVYALDAEAARDAGWGDAGASPAELLERAAAEVRRRFEVCRRAWWVEVTTEPTAGRLRVDVKDDVEERARLLIDGMIRSLGLLELLIVAEPADLEVPGADTGEPPRVVRLPCRPPAGEPAGLLPLLLPDRLQDAFGAGHFERVVPDEDERGYPAIRFELVPARVDELRDYTRRHVGRRLAVVVRGEVLTAPTLATPLAARGLLTGLRDPAEQARLVDALRRGHGPLRPFE